MIMTQGPATCALSAGSLATEWGCRSRWIGSRAPAWCSNLMTSPQCGLDISAAMHC